MQDKIIIFYLACYTPNLWEYESHNIFGLIEEILSEFLDHDSNDPISHEQPETPKAWVDYYWHSVIN